MQRFKQVVLNLALVLFTVWLAAASIREPGDDSGLIRLVLGLLFAAAVLFRIKPVDGARPAHWGELVGAAAAGVLLTVGGLFLNVGQFEWLGILALLYGFLRWGFPPRYGRDVLIAIFLLYWIHPLPGQVFGPLQMAMQWLSVQGSEWFLQALNARAWADGFVLRTPLRDFGVPEACSGMRTAVTVLYCTLGVGFLFRFRLVEMAVFLAVGLAQVLVLNILRIAFLVMWAVRMPLEWGETFLHDSLGIFLLLAILLVQLEASAWQVVKRRRQDRADGIESGRREKPDVATTLPRFWYVLIKGLRIGLLVALVVGVVAFAAFKRRPFHRAMMMGDVVVGLAERDLNAAERAIGTVINWAPDVRDHKVKRIQIQLMKGRYAAALAGLDSLPKPLDESETVLKSRALMMLGRSEEAVKLIRALPEMFQQQAPVAMLMAEYGAIRNDAEMVKANIVKAAQSHLLVDRVRMLYPFLQQREQWQTIVDTDNVRVPYDRVGPAAIAIRAHIRMNRLARAARLLEQALERWPQDPQFLSSLLTMAVQDPGGKWEQQFVEQFKAQVGRLDADSLAGYLQQCFRMGRPDIGWLAWWHLKTREPRDPALPFVAARFGDAWMTFRRRLLGLNAVDPMSVVDLRPFYRQTAGLRPFSEFWRQVPLAADLGAGDPSARQNVYLQMCLAELKLRGERKELTTRMENNLPAVLAMAGDYGQAHQALDTLLRKYPQDREEYLFRHAVLYEQQGRWQESYEVLREHRDVARLPNLAAEIMRINAMVNMNLGASALMVARAAAARFPDSVRVREILAAIWASYGYDEESLFVLDRPGMELNPRLMAQVLYESQRYVEAERMARGLGVDLKRAGPAPAQPYVAPPAELTVTRRWPPPLAREPRLQQAQDCMDRARQAKSPFLRQLSELETEWLRDEGGRNLSKPELWESVARDDLEKAAALNRLAMLQARQGQFEAASRTAERTCKQMPACPVYWWILIGLREGDRTVVQEARRNCPDDGEIWLADLVSRFRADGKGTWIDQEVDRALAANAYPVGTLVRAGNYLVRQGVLPAARKLAGYVADARARGYLPAHVLMLHCALVGRDTKGALSAALKCADYALDPSDFYKTIVEIKSSGLSMDADLLSALEFLQSRYPKDPTWVERLGYIYLVKGDSKRAESILEPLMEGGAGVSIRTLNMAAEAARSQGNNQRSIRVLETARTLYPDDMTILNNLVYNLARSHETAARALELLPELIQSGSEHYEVLDTAATVYLKNGRIEEAQLYMDKALAKLPESSVSYAPAETRINAVEILLRQGEIEKAAGMLDAVDRMPNKPAFLEGQARELRRQIQSRSSER